MVRCQNQNVESFNTCEKAKVERIEYIRIHNYSTTTIKVSLIGQETGNFYVLTVKQTESNKEMFTENHVYRKSNYFIS
jgi:hypothetical protein